MGGDKYCSFSILQSLSKVLPLVISPLKSVISGLILLSKNLENAISQNGKSEKYFYAPFLIHMVVEFKKSKLPTLLHFVQVKRPYQPHVTQAVRLIGGHATPLLNSSFIESGKNL